MGTDIRSILRVGLLNKEVTADTNFIVADDILRKGPAHEDDDDIYPNQTGIAFYTVEVIPTTTGLLSVYISDDSEIPVTITGQTYSCIGGEMSIHTLYVRDNWHINFRYSETDTLKLFCIAEHGGVY